MIQCGICRKIVANGSPTIAWIDDNEWAFIYMNKGNLLLCRKCTVVAMATLEATRQYIPNMEQDQPAVSCGGEASSDEADTGDECPKTKGVH